MRLRAIELDQFRKFDRPVRVDGLGPGVNVLCGPNEHGKSTLMAALRAVLFERHNSRTEAIRGYQNRRGSTAPTVALEFELEGSAHRIEKRFVLRPMARLLSDGVAHEGDAAEERLQRLLGVSAPSRAVRDAAKQAASIWGALLVDQGDSFAQAALGEGARTTLSDCLQAELGSVSGGAAIGRLLKQVQGQLGALLDGRGQPRDRYKAVLAEDAAASAEIAELGRRRHALDGDLSAAAAARRELAREADPADGERIANQLAQARRHRDVLLGLRDRLRHAEGEVRLAQAAHDAVLAEQASRATRAAALSEAERALAGLVRTEAEARARVDASHAALSDRRAAHDAAARSHDASLRALHRAAARRAASLQASACAASRVRLTRAQDAAARVAAASAALARLRPDEDAMRALQDAVLADRGNQAALQAQATVLELDLGMAAQLEVEGEAADTVPPGPVRLSLIRPAVLTLRGLGTIRIVPAARDREHLLARAQDTARALRRLLEAAGCADMAQAERVAAERQAVRTALDGARRVLAEAAPNGTGALREQAAADADALARMLAELGLDAAPDADEAASALDASGAAEQQARDALHAAQDALLAPDAARELAEATLQQAALDRRTREAERNRLDAERQRASATEADAALDAWERAAADALRSRRDAMAAITASAPDGTPELADAAIRRLEESQSNRRGRIASLREAIARLDARIAAEEGVGLDEAIEVARRRQEAAARSVAHDAREVAVLSLLRDTLREADQAARERYLLPLTTRIRPYLQALFPRARLSLNEDFLIDGLSRGETGTGEEGEAFDDLSHGTREQIAILSRLAFADMLLGGGRPAFLVLDDALAFADGARMERMFDILSDAGTRMQIVVLTCREEVASRLGGTRIGFADAART